MKQILHFSFIDPELGPMFAVVHHKGREIESVFIHEIGQDGILQMQTPMSFFPSTKELKGLIQKIVDLVPPIDIT